MEQNTEHRYTQIRRFDSNIQDARRKYRQWHRYTPNLSSQEYVRIATFTSLPYGTVSKRTPLTPLLFPQWSLTTTGSTNTALTGNLAGSAAEPVSITDIIALSSDPETTRANLRFDALPLGLGAYAGSARLRETVTSLYDTSKVGVKADDVVIANATTGANLLVLHSLLQKGDHVITLYPCYGQLVQYPAAMGAEVSLWRLREEKGWELDVEDLKALIRPGKTKMLILNNPHNPTGTVLSSALQREIVDVCREHGIVILSDEIFRPLFHDPLLADETTSFLEQVTAGEYDKVIVTGSLSKPYGLSGTRVGWVVTTNPELRRIVISMRQWMLQSVSVVDEVIATEVLSERCRVPLLKKTLDRARGNLALLREVVEGSQGRLECKIPVGGGTAFIKIVDASGKSVDDVPFCHALLEAEGVLLAPGSLTFGGGEGREFVGYVRLHITAPPEMFKKRVEGLKRFVGR